MDQIVIFTIIEIILIITIILLLIYRIYVDRHHYKIFKNHINNIYGKLQYIINNLKQNRNESKENDRLTVSKWV